MIIKVQRPLMTTDPSLPYLVYDKTRKHEYMIPKHQMDSKIVKLMANQLKLYFEAEVVHDTVYFGKMVEEQPW